MNKFSRSWEITKLSFDVIKKDKELLLFPFLAMISSVLFIIAMVFPSISALVLGKSIDYSTLEYILIFLTYLGLAFIATFFNVCVVYTTKKRFEGGNASFGESIKFAFSKAHLIFSWSVMSATVGLLLRIIDGIAEKMGSVGEIIVRILNSIFGMIWSIITIFVIPGMVYHNLGPIDAIKRSIETLKKTWGESLIRYFSLGLIQFLVLIIGLILLIPFFWIFGGWAILLIGLFVIIVFLVFSVANTIFNTALFVYADTGNIPKGYNQEIMSNAFRKR